MNFVFLRNQSNYLINLNRYSISHIIIYFMNLYKSIFAIVFIFFPMKNFSFYCVNDDIFCFLSTKNCNQIGSLTFFKILFDNIRHIITFVKLSLLHNISVHFKEMKKICSYHLGKLSLFDQNNYFFLFFTFVNF